mgnify:CR=1 FL=1
MLPGVEKDGSRRAAPTHGAASSEVAAGAMAPRALAAAVAGREHAFYAEMKRRGFVCEDISAAAGLDDEHNPEKAGNIRPVARQ